MACPPRAGDRVGAEAAWTEGLDINLVERARAPHRERHAGARAHPRRRRAAARLEQTVHNSGCDGRVRARAAGARGSFSSSRPLHRRSRRRALLMATARCPRYARARCLNGMRASALAHALRADARAWIDMGAASDRVRDII